MLFVQPSFLIRLFYSGLIWRMPTRQPEVYLTFDDGPEPEATPFVLSQLKKWNALATFFCIGNNIEKHQELFNQIVSAGHQIGNHTQNHLNGWNNHLNTYLADVEQCSTHISSGLFRPPYGKITLKQIRSLRSQWQIIMWDVLSYDFETNVSPAKCIQNVMQHVRPGSIIVFHDSKKALKNLSETLPVVLEKLSAKGYSFNAMPPYRPLQ
jgi:peptidoglycan/xylan/chitin deacetylase (PgdA/CDA1 family)